MRSMLITGILLLSLQVRAQDKTVRELRDAASRNMKNTVQDTTNKPWKKGGLFGINVSQGSLSNWAAGGDEFSLSVNSVFSGFAFYKRDKHSWDNTLDFNLGYVNTTSLGGRKNDDRIDLVSKYGYALTSKLNIAGLVNFRSQFFNGYTYEEDIRTKVSSLLAPAYLLVSPGLDYRPAEGLSIFLSPITVRWTFVRDDSLSSAGLYGVTPGKHSANEIGAFGSVNYIREFNKIVTYRSRLDLFSNYKSRPQNIDINFTNLLSVKLLRLLSLTWSVDMIYDDDARLFGPDGESPALQLKSLIGVGLQFNFGAIRK